MTILFALQYKLHLYKSTFPLLQSIINNFDVFQVYVPNHPNNTVGLPTPNNPINFSTNSLSSNEGMNGGAPPLSLQHPATFSSLIYQQPRSNIQLYNQLQVPYSSNR